MNFIDKRGDKLIEELKKLFHTDALINEFELIPILEPISNSSPLILTNHKLGIELWAAQLAFNRAYQLVFMWKRKQSHIEYSDLDHLSRVVLLVNNDCMTVWNIRKQLVRDSFIEPSAELKFTYLVLTKHPKSVETFSQRRWLLEYLLQQNQITKCSEHHHQCVVQPEMIVCEKAADKYLQNYYAWNHRIWITQNFSQYCETMLQDEMTRSASWIQAHVSDHCGYHYRAMLLRRKLNLSSGHNAVYTEQASPSYSSFPGQADPVNNVREGEVQCHPCVTLENIPPKIAQLLTSELQRISDTITFYIGHEAAWCYRRYIVEITTDYVLQQNGITAQQTCVQNNQQRLPCKRFKPSGMEDSEPGQSACDVEDGPIRHDHEKDQRIDDLKSNTILDGDEKNQLMEGLEKGQIMNDLEKEQRLEKDETEQTLVVPASEVNVGIHDVLCIYCNEKRFCVTVNTPDCDKWQSTLCERYMNWLDHIWLRKLAISSSNFH